METKIDIAVNEYLSILVNEDKIDDITIQNLLDKVRNSYNLDAVYIIENRNNNLEFYYSYISCDKPLYSCLGKVFNLTDAQYASVLSMYNNQKIRILTPENNTEKFTCDYCMTYGFLEGSFCQGFVVFQSTNKKVWNLEEQEALKKLSRAVRGFIINKESEYRTGKDINELNSSLQIAYESAAKANNAKTEFLYRMSHEIRTPINAIICMAAIADANLSDKEKVADCLEKINVAGSHLLSLVNDVLDMSKVESGKLSLSEKEFNLSELIDNLLDIVEPSVNERNHELTVCIKNIEHEDVIGDTLRIQQAFINILSNAVKYTKNNGKICITISEKPTEKLRMGCYEFIFEDNGFGMSEEFLKILFKPFERAKDDRINKIQGTGLGMAITENIVRMMNGDIKVESKLGKGTKFTVTIFLKLQDTQPKTFDEFIGLPVLVVDNDKFICESICNKLNELQMKSEWVLSGKEAVKKVSDAEKQNKQYFAVIINQKMTDMDGTAITGKIRRIAGNRVSIIIFSAYNCSNIKCEAMAAGADVFVSKPLFKSRLINIFRDLVSKQHNNDNNGCNQLNELRKRNYSDKRILIVEDNELNREIAVEILKIAGLNVEEAKDGIEAVNMVTSSETGYYNIIFMDIQMPAMNGYQASAAIRALKRKDLKDIPIIAMTASSFTEDVQSAKSCGMNDHITKPIDFKKLIKILNDWL